ncbi:hypothetical protein CLU85_2385 [Acidovorax sp. 69]|uniref:hypothetical protein n=1 Tax=Acidovorax sp. 69 TaxID=2035202 RepID=UPI000CB8C399|nr:hypothetical protein [Acidovorax sp. 69]PJI97593.1 hypothetical protein CLU85_2385 [Acidovorax sp. 69]
MKNQSVRWIFALMGLTLGAGAMAQSTVGELLEKGGKQNTKAEIMALMPMRIQQKWPNGQGEEELFFSVDGKITGTGSHYSSRTDSPVEGTWTVEEDGKFCAPKKFTKWGNSTNLCWYGFRLGENAFSALKTDADTKLFKTNSVTKIGG